MDLRNVDFSFMKAGRNNPMNNELSDVETINILSLVTTFTENALITACEYIKHSNRKIVTAKDINMAMKLEVFEFLKKDNTKTMEKHKKELTKDYFGLNTDGDEDSEVDEEDDYLENQEDEEEEFTRSKCKCELCSKIHLVEDNWKSWEPKTELEVILKRNIDRV